MKMRNFCCQILCRLFFLWRNLLFSLASPWSFQSVSKISGVFVVNFPIIIVQYFLQSETFVITDVTTKSMCGTSSNWENLSIYYANLSPVYLISCLFSLLAIFSTWWFRNTYDDTNGSKLLAKVCFPMLLIKS